MSAARPRPARLAGAASLVYLLSWIAGLLATPPAPSGASAVELHSHLADHRLGAVVQSLLVHGTAGAALAVLAVSLGRLAARHTGGRGPALVAGAGTGAALLSWVQVAVLIVLVAGLDRGSAERTVALRHAIDLVDGAKLAALAVFAVVAAVLARRTGLGHRWVAVLAWILAPLLLAGAASFVVRTQVLTATLYVSLPLLLLVVGAIGTTTWWRARIPAGAAAPAGAVLTPADHGNRRR